jgi:hypothetical protein
MSATQESIWPRPENQASTSSIDILCPSVEYATTPKSIHTWAGVYILHIAVYY